MTMLINDQPPAFHEWMTVAEVADELRVSRKTVYRAVRSEEIPVIRVRRSIRLNAGDVLGWAIASDRRCRAV